MNPRNPNYNIIKKNLSPSDLKDLLKVFSQMCMIRNFELVAFEYRQKKIYQTLIYLCVGQESIYTSIAQAIPKAYVFGQHRAHGTYLAYGGNPVKLVDEIVGLPTGGNKGMGASPTVCDKAKNIFGHVGLIGDQVPVAAGFALEKRDKPVICFVGDGAVEEDYVLATFGFVKQYNLKILFVCDDNDLSVLTPTKDRRKWKLSEVANSFGIESVDITDDPLTIIHYAKKLIKKAPALINIRTCRELWHEGAGKDSPDKGFWSRYQILKKNLLQLGYKNFVEKEENKYKNWSEKLWKKRLQKLLKN